MEAEIGLVIVSSNSGNTSPEALMVFSIFPFSTTAVVIDDLFMEDLKEKRSNQMAVSKTSIVARIEIKIFRFLFRISCSGKTVSIFLSLHNRFQAGCQV